MAVSVSLHCFISSFIFFASFQYASAASTLPQDVNALLALRNAWSSIPTSWDSSTDPCQDQWLGVLCDITGTRVTQLLLINQDLNGNLPAAIGNLTSLTDLDLSFNRKLGGNIPPEIGNLTSLKKFYLQTCGFSGTIPSEIGNLKSLTNLGLNENFLTGSIPATIGQLTQLNWFDVSSNKLSGNLPVSTSTGSVGLDTLTKAEHFHLQNNSFSGSIPSTLFNSQMILLHLLLHNNSFSGEIPPTVENLQRIDILRMDFNNLNGPIPANISRLTTLTALQLNNNGLTGQVPDLSTMTNLQILDLSNNQYDPAEIPFWISTLKNISLLSMQYGNLIGEVPADIFSLSKISNVTLGSNNLNGTLDLQNAASSLHLVDVENNHISSLEKGDYSQDLILDGNPFCNNNPDHCTQSAPSPSPAGLSDCSCSVPHTPNPKASGQCICYLPVIGHIDFSAYKDPILSQFSREMAEKFAEGLSSYVYGGRLNFTTEQVVLNFVSSTQAIILVFPPGNMTAWSSSAVVQISYALKNQDVEFPDIGPYVCEFLSPVVTVGGLSTGAKIGIGIGVAVAVIVILVVGAYAAKQKKRADRAEESRKPFAAWMDSGGESVDIPQLKGARWFSFAEIKKVTNNFSENNEIGKGGYGKVYRGYLLSGEQVAIKRAHPNSLQGAAEFKNEIELLSRVHHRNLVGLVGFCFEQGEQMLVYEFMPNGTMHECLSGRNGLHMDWERRLALALGSARGIAYLHTEANPPIIHRDIKSSNILLDEKLVAKVADFGISKLAPDDDGTGKDYVSTQVKGTMGYLDPDYFMTRMLTHKSDVYSFGVVLLELITGRQPFERGKYIVREVKLAIGRGGMDNLQPMIDPHLTDSPPEALERFVSIALSCLQEDAASRPAMGEVVKGLEALVQKSAGALEIDMGNDRSDLYTNWSLEQASGTSFEYSGGYGMPTIVEPK